MFNYIQTFARMTVMITPLDQNRPGIRCQEFPMITYAGNTPISIETHKENVTTILRSALESRIAQMLASSGLTPEEVTITPEVLLLEAERQENNGEEFVRF